MININNFTFPKKYLFSIIDPNGGIWLNPSNEKSNEYFLGISSVLAEKLDIIEEITFSNREMLIKNEIFLRIKGKFYEMNLFSPIDAKIIEINSDVQIGTKITQKSVYETHWLIKLILEDFNQGDWFNPNSRAFKKYVDFILKTDKKLQEKCCPDFFDSNIKRRLKN